MNDKNNQQPNIDTDLSMQVCGYDDTEVRTFAAPKGKAPQWLIDKVIDRSQDDLTTVSEREEIV